MALTNDYRNIIVDSLTGRKGSSGGLGISQVYIGLSSTPPQPSKTGTLPDGTAFDNYNITEPPAYNSQSQETGYGRTLIGQQSQSQTLKFGAAVNGEAKNEQYIYFPEAKASWGDTLTHFVLFKTDTGKDPIAYAKLMNGNQAAPITVNSANTVVLFRPNDLIIKYVDVLEDTL